LIFQVFISWEILKNSCKCLLSLNKFQFLP